MSVRNHQCGIVLITIMILLTGLSLLVVSQLSQVFIYYKALNQTIEKEQNFYQLETEAIKLSIKVASIQQRSCVVKEKDPNEIIFLLQDNQGCWINHKQQQFYYLIEDLGIFPCLRVTSNKGTKSTHHWRISISKKAQNSSFLQLRFSSLAEDVQCEKKEINLIKTGLLSWRYLKSKSKYSISSAKQLAEATFSAGKKGRALTETSLDSRRKNCISS